jgi:hypothetical protein
MQAEMKPFILSTVTQWGLGIGGLLLSAQGVVGFILGSSVTILTVYKLYLDVQIRRIQKRNLETQKPILPD